MKVAFFDFDGTLTKHDTFIEFAKFSMGKRTFFKAFLKSVPSLCLWKLGLRSNSEAKQTLFSLLYKGMDYMRFKELGIAYIPWINIDARTEIIEIMKRHKCDGHKIIVVSASIGDWIRPWAENIGIDEVIATEVEVDEFGKLTGRFLTKNCYGIEKVARIQRLFPQIGNCETWGYGDSSGDDAMLTLVNHPHRV